MGEVYLARQTQWDANIAVKVPKDEIVSDPENRRFISREAEAWTKLGLHPHIAYCYYAQQVDELLLLVVEYVDGGNLRSWIADGRCADLKTGLDLAIQFCHGLEHAHKQGLVHRDIKPENILLTNDGTLKVTDFGIAHRAKARAETPAPAAEMAHSVAEEMTIVGIGTAEYMPPEQWGGEQEIDLRADIFAFGVCLYEMLCGRLPYSAKATLGQRLEPPEPDVLLGDAKLPKRLSELMKRCVDWDRERRPAGVHDVLAELCRLYEEVFGEPNGHAELLEMSTLADDWNNRALSFLALGLKEEAEKAWRTALGADAEHAESTYNYGLQQWREAKITDQRLVGMMQAIAENDSSMWLSKYLLAQVNLERGDTEAVSKGLSGIGDVEASRDEWAATRRAVEEFAAPTQLIRSFEGHTGYVMSVNLGLDGRLALSGSIDKTLRLWDLAGGRCLRTFEGHTSTVSSVCLSADGQYALSSSHDKTLKLWEVDTGRCLRTFEGGVRRP